MRTLCIVGLALCLATVAVAAGGGRDEESILFDASYGRRLPESTRDVALWWASSGWKVARTRPVPGKSGEAIRIGAARNEREAAQLVVNPSRALSGFLATSETLRGPDGASIDADNVEVLRVRYVNVARQTDKWGAQAPWPDPLPPFKGPIDLAAGENQPFWVRVYVPKETPQGAYEGFIHLAADGYEARVPLHVRVYGFDLPERMTLRTAMGFSDELVYQYHGLADEAQKRQVLDLYWENLRQHHISPYRPAPLDPFTFEWVKLGEGEGADLPPEDRKLLREHALTPRFDWSAWDKEALRVAEKFHFNALRLGSPGMGTLQGFEVGTRGCELAFNGYYRAIQEHLREVGLLDAAFVYWTDEPRPTAYARVKKGFERIKKAAPDLDRLLTEQVEPELIDGPNIWCVLPYKYDHAVSNERRRAGDIFWWYVCTGPKQPYPGLFTDHPGTDFRVWLWQTWKYDFKGILVWRLNRWTSKDAYPDHPQSPYEDPMSWRKGWGGDGDPLHPYGNGDGMFLYPPEAAAGVAEEPVFDPPVDSIRWEMIRDGIEDYEYLSILKRLLDERKGTLSRRKYQRFEGLLEVPDEITSDLTAYTKDPAPIEEQRDRVAKAIEELASR
jgi:Glycoside hydrolase 123, catalytic domain/Glycoside hydrolase 123 N-terminal domain